MEQINETELKRKGKTIELKIDGVISLDITMQKVKCSYNIKNGILNIYDNQADKRITIETLIAYMIKASENKKTIEIKLDNDEDIIMHIYKGNAPKF